MNHIRVCWLTCVLFLAAVAASATTIVLPTDDQLIAKSPVIVKATVVSSTPVDRDGKIWTETLLSVDASIKGNVSGTLTVREIGGVIGNRITKIFGTPRYTAGEHVLAFLTPTPRGDYQTTDLYVGKFSEKTTLSGERLWHRDDANADVALLDSNFNAVKPRNLQRRADAFEQYVAARVAHRAIAASYTIENPILQRTGATGGMAIKDNFTLISEPTVYRWFAFEQGQTVNWYSSGQQSGYTGGGINEISTAMASWSGYTAALIRYNYAGAAAGSLQPLSTQDGVNGILFNDPYQEIAGSYNAATGGVVGVGGLNGVSNQRSWTATFSADGTHVAGTYQAWDIVEGGLTIQDGVSPANGISSTLLSEIVAHEFGHTLGFGHSSDATALMYPTVSGRGPSLRTDDQLAARWLYPNGSSTPTPTPTVPAAATNLVATPSGTSVVLQWKDNAGTSETGETLYYATTTSAFVKVGNLAAGSTTATMNGFTAGTYKFQVTSFNGSGESLPSNTASATIGSMPPPAPAPVASFSLTPTSGTAGTTVFTVTDQSSGTISSRTWTWGDGTTASTSTAQHVYSLAGQYVITLIVSGNGTSQATQVVTVANAAPVVPPVQPSFDFTPASPTTADTVQFNDRSSGAPSAWSWSFGDGATASQPNPQHRYGAAGTYTVTMTAANSVSSATATRSITVAALAPYRSLVSASAQTNGIGGSVWRTELTILNAGSEAAYGQLILVPGAGEAPRAKSLYLAPRQSVTYENALLDIFGLSSGAGAIAIEANSAASTPLLKITSRTFTTSTNGGTYGQAVPEVTASDLQPTLYLTGIESDAAFRTNVGLVNRSDAPVGVSLTLIDENGNVVSTNGEIVPANSFSQQSLATFFPPVSGVALAGLSLRIDAAAADAISAYASVIDNRTQDPVYIQAMPLRNGSERVIPAAGRAGGANGTFWRSDVTLFNPTGSMESLTLRYLAGGADNTNAMSRTISIPAGRTIVYADVLQSLFGMSSGTGSLSIAWAGGGVGPIVASRTYTTVSGGGTFGQAIDPIEAWSTDGFVPGLRSDFAFRSNVGFVNGSGSTINVALTLIASNGQTIANGFVQLPPRSMTQSAVGNFFPGVDVASLGNFTLQAHTDAGAVLFAYGSIVDNSSGDPVFYAGQ